MSVAYATTDQLEDRLSSTYTMPADAAALLLKASELIDEHTLGRAARLYASLEVGDEARIAALADAVCDQVEFWLEVGEEHDVAGLRGSLVAGRVQVHPVPMQLGQRARRSLRRAGLNYLGVSAG